MSSDHNRPGESAPQGWQRLMIELQSENNRRLRAEVEEVQTRHNAALFDKAMAYANGITVVGYAGFFGLWQLTKEHLSRETVLSSALAMGISILIFVTFEITKMVVIQVALLRAHHALAKPGISADPKAFLEHTRAVQRFADAALTKLMRFWAAAFGVSVLSGLVAVGILLTAFVRGLLHY